MKKPLLLFEWDTLDEESHAILLINDTDEEEARVEHVVFGEEEETWHTESVLSTLESISDYSIPNSFFDAEDES